MKTDFKKVPVESSQQGAVNIRFFPQLSKPNSVSCHAHIHNTIELLYVTDGRYDVLIDGRADKIGEGDLMLFCSNSIHYVTSRDAPVNNYYVIKIPPSAIMELSGREIGAEYVMRFTLNREGQKNIWRREELYGTQIEKILARLIEEHRSGGYASELAVKLGVMELVLAILREGDRGTNSWGSQPTEQIYYVMSYVADNFADDIDERELAQRFGMSYSYFTRSFKRVSGMTFRKYLNVTRIRKAEQILSTTEDSITVIAAKCGYNSTSYFIHTYKSITGKTPHQMRK